MSVSIIYDSRVCVKNRIPLKIPDSAILGGFPAVNAGYCLAHYGT